MHLIWSISVHSKSICDNCRDFCYKVNVYSRFWLAIDEPQWLTEFTTSYGLFRERVDKIRKMTYYISQLRYWQSNFPVKFDQKQIGFDQLNPKLVTCGSKNSRNKFSFSYLSSDTSPVQFGGLMPRRTTITRYLCSNTAYSLFFRCLSSHMETVQYNHYITSF